MFCFFFCFDFDFLFVLEMGEGELQMSNRNNNTVCYRGISLYNFWRVHCFGKQQSLFTDYQTFYQTLFHCIFSTILKLPMNKTCTWKSKLQYMNLKFHFGVIGIFWNSIVTIIGQLCTFAKIIKSNICNEIFMIYKWYLNNAASNRLSVKRKI